ncbi:tenascin-R-like, partial [Saccoglossus kowalevskii]
MAPTFPDVADRTITVDETIPSSSHLSTIADMTSQGITSVPPTTPVSSTLFSTTSQSQGRIANFYATDISATTTLIKWTLGLDAGDVKYIGVSYLPVSEGAPSPGSDVHLWQSTIGMNKDKGEIRLTNLFPSTNYKYVLLLTNNRNDILETTDVKYFMTRAVPIPVDVNVDAVQEDLAIISWSIYDDIHLIGEILIQYRAEYEDIWSNKTITSRNEMSVVLTNLVSSMKYQFQFVVSSPERDQIEITNVYTFTTIEVKHVPYDLQVVNITTREALLTWKLHENSTILEALVQYQPVESHLKRSTENGWVKSPVLASALSFKFTDLQPDSEYRTKITSVSVNDNWSGETETLYFNTFALPLPYMTMDKVGDNSALVSWIYPEDKDLVGSQIIQYTIVDDGHWTVIPLDINASYIEIENLLPNTAYVFNMVVENTDGNKQRRTRNVTFITLE